MSQTERTLYSPFALGPITLANRMVMAPLTRNRAEPGNVPGPMTIEYYAQRASVGLIIAEATQVSAQAQGYIATPGLHTPEQIAGWKKVTDEVHARGGKIFVQLWHTGRMSHTAYQPDGQAQWPPQRLPPKPRPSWLVKAWWIARCRALWKPQRSLAWSMTSAQRPVTPSRRALTAWKSTGLTATCWTPSCVMAPTSAPTSTAAASRTAAALRWRLWRRCARRRGRPAR